MCACLLDWKYLVLTGITPTTGGWAAQERREKLEAEVIRNHFWVLGFEIYESCIDVEMFLREQGALYCVSKTGFALAILIFCWQCNNCARNTKKPAASKKR